METNQARTTRYLQDLHAAEKAACDPLESISDRVDLPTDLRTLLTDEIHRSHQRSNQIIESLRVLGTDTNSLKDFMNNAFGKITGLSTLGQDQTDRLTTDLIKIHAASHGLHASYLVLETHSIAAGDVATTTFANESAEQCRKFADSVIEPLQDCVRTLAVQIPTAQFQI